MVVVFLMLVKTFKKLFNFNIATKLNEPSVTKSFETQLKQLHEFQLFDKKMV